MREGDQWPDAFPRTSRFSRPRLLGAGAFGAVFETYDHEREELVALKSLHRLDADALLGLKREFRALADVRHPNLVRLYELFADGGRWFLTMELVHGCDFLAFVRDGAKSAYAPTASDSTARGLTANDSTIELAARDTFDASARHPPPSPPADPARLRDALRQLAEGLAALHERGKLHRDLKPSNVLVTRGGRVVIVDFGLAIESKQGADASVSVVAGTPAYMAPEQAFGQRLSPASDWYAVGVMLYEALTGVLPFSGSAFEIIFQKRDCDPGPPRSVAPGCPEDLDALCARLTQKQPTARPHTDEILACLRAAPSSRRGHEPLQRQTPFVGRERHLSVLRDAFALSKRGQAATVHIRGSSGLGKTTLIRRFLDDLVADGEAVILEGRCYERESVPYKGLDSVIDALARYLGRLPPIEAALLLPRDIQASVRLFPVLGRIEAVRRSPRRDVDAAEARELRRRGFAALRELVVRIAEERPLVVYIDDLQWGDADGAALLAEIMRPPGGPAMLLLGSYRSDDADRSALLRNLPAWLGIDLEQALSTNVTDLVVGPLEPAEAEALSLALLGEQHADKACAVAIESGYSPFFIREIVESLHERGGEAPEIRLGAVLSQRIDRLAGDARRVIEIIAVSGRPLPQDIAQEAAGIGPARAHDAIEAVCAAHLARRRGSRDEEELETFHDRIREATVGLLPPDVLAERHLALATALERSGRAEAHVLAGHFRRGGAVEKAADYMVVAGDRAAEALAFERAARHYATALDLRPTPHPGRRALQIKLGDALANAGRGADAARTYLAASGGAARDEELELLRRAAASYLRSGYYDDGMACLRDVLAAVDMEVPRTPAIALAQLLAVRARLRLRGLGFRERPAVDIDFSELRRIDICWSAGIGLAMIDQVRGSYFQAQHLRLALDCGEPSRVARALAIEVPFVAVPGGSARERADELLREAERLAERTGTPHARGLLRVSAGMRHYLMGRFRDAIANLDEAELTLREECTGVSWERGSALTIGIWSRWFTGDLSELVRRLPAAIREAEERGDRYVAANLRSYFSNAHWLILDDPTGARREADAAIQSWSRSGFHQQHLHHMIARAGIALYVGDPEESYRLFAERWSSLRASLALRMQTARAYTTHLRARAALALAFTIGHRRRREALLGEVERGARRLEKERMPWIDPLAASLRAGVAAARGEVQAAARSFADAAQGFHDADMALFAATARRRQGECCSGDRGDALVAEANAWMREQGIVDPDRITAMMAPSGAH